MSIVRQPLVLVFQSLYYDVNHRETEGIFSYAREAGWRVQTVEYDYAVEGRLHLTANEKGSNISGLLDFWKPDGCIVDCGGRSKKFDCEDFGRIPLVFLDGHPLLFGKKVSCVYSDAEKIAECAIRELLPLGFADYAYLPWSEDRIWSRLRGEAFSRLVNRNGKTMHNFAYRDKRRLIMSKLQPELVKWCKALPRPCGVFAANDMLANAFVTVALSAGFSVPNDFAVLGVDDNVQLCENASVSISSIGQDCEQAGFLAAKLLDRILADRRRKPDFVTFDPLGVHRRASTRFFRGVDAGVTKAIEYIRLHACEGVGPREVVKAVGISRTQLDLRFRKKVGHTLLDEIHAVRLQHVQELLARGVTPQALADRCGYKSVVDLRRVFRQRLGQTIGDYLSTLPRTPFVRGSICI